MQILLATNNQHKLRELQAILENHEVLAPGELGITSVVEETGTTFLQNALLKATTIRAQAIRSLAGRAAAEKLIVVADDSGLCVDALDGRPGIYSARYGSPDGETELDAGVRNARLLRELGDEPRRSARFVCCMVAILADYRVISAQESWEGEITTEQANTDGGFGYDPVFYVPSTGCTAAELPPAQKNTMSHRGRATSVLVAALEAAESLA